MPRSKQNEPSTSKANEQSMDTKEVYLSKDFKIAYKQIEDILSAWSLDTINAYFGYSRDTFDVVAFRIRMEKELKAEELGRLVLIFLTRGNNIKSIITREATSEVAQFLKKMSSAIGLKSQARGKTQSPTLARMALAFPDVAAHQLIQFPRMVGPVTLESLKNTLDVSEIPAICRLPSLCCLIPRDADFVNTVMDLFLFSSMCLLGKIYQNSLRWMKMDNDMKVREAVAFQKIALNSPVMSDEVRWWCCSTYGIVVPNGRELTALWSEACSAATKKMNSVYKVTYSDL